MRVFTQFPDRNDFNFPIALTIGNFDGLHLGHQVVLKRLKDVSKEIKGKSVVLTFANHPSTVLRPDHPVHALCSNEQKLKLFEAFGIDAVLLLPFTKDLSQNSAEIFLQKINSAFHFHHLILGHDATIGKERHGDKMAIQSLAVHLDFEVEYLPQQLIEAIPVSSSLIRELIRKGDLTKAEKLLGRPFSIYKKVMAGKGLGKKLGYATANIDVTGLCLPPQGVYAIILECDNRHYNGIANLGIAPTLRETGEVLLEVHLFDCDEDFYDKLTDVNLRAFIRPERKFTSVEQLKAQIADDIVCVKSLLEKESQKNRESKQSKNSIL